MNILGYNISLKRSAKKPVTSSIEKISMASVEPPRICENQNKGWVDYGEKNLFPQELIKFREQCGTHAAILQTKATMIAGKSVRIEWTGEKQPGDETKMKILLENGFGHGTLHEMVYEGAYQMCEQGAFTAELTKDLSDEELKKYSMFNICDVSKIRSGIFNADGIVDKYYYCRNWAKTSMYDPKPYQAFGTFKEGRKDKKGNVILPPLKEIAYFRRNLTGMEYYGQPSYIAAIQWIKINIQMGCFHLSNLENGYNPSIIFRFYKKPESDEEKENIVEGLRESFSGPDKTGKAVIVFSDGKDNACDIHPIEVSNLDKQLLLLGDQVMQEILTSQRVTTPGLLGVANPGKLGFSSELKTGALIFDSIVIQPEQTFIQNKFTKLIQTCDLKAKMVIEPLDMLAQLQKQ